MTIEAAENPVITEMKKIIEEAPRQLIYFKGRNHPISDPETPPHVVTKYVHDRLKVLSNGAGGATEASTE